MSTGLAPFTIGPVREDEHAAVLGLLAGHHLPPDGLDRHWPQTLVARADGFFPRFGFTRVTRADVPAGVRQSIEFTAACPASAIVMRRLLSQP